MILWFDRDALHSDWTSLEAFLFKIPWVSIAKKMEEGGSSATLTSRRYFFGENLRNRTIRNVGPVILFRQLYLFRFIFPQRPARDFSLHHRVTLLRAIFLSFSSPRLPRCYDSTLFRPSLFSQGSASARNRQWPMLQKHSALLRLIFRWKTQVVVDLISHTRETFYPQSCRKSLEVECICFSGDVNLENEGSKQRFDQERTVFVKIYKKISVSS